MTISADEVSTEQQARQRTERLIAYHVSEIMKTYGPPPLIIGEDPKDFQRALVKLVSARCSNNDVFLHMDVWDMAIAILLDKRYDRASSRVLNRRIRENLEFQQTRPKQKLLQA